MTAMFDLYFLLVENLFGSVLLSGVGLTVLFIIMGMISRMSPTSIIILVGYFIAVFSIGYAGEIGAVLIFIFAFIYFAKGMLRFFMTWI